MESRGEGCLSARGREARACSGGVGEHMARSVSDWPSNHKAVFLSLQQCWQSLEKTLPPPAPHPRPLLLSSALTVTQAGAEGASGGSGLALALGRCWDRHLWAGPASLPTRRPRLGLSLPSLPAHQAPSHLWIAQVDPGCGSQGSELALAGVVQMSGYECLCLCNVWNFPPPVSVPGTLAGFFGSLGRVVFRTAQRTRSIYPIN